MDRTAVPGRPLAGIVSKPLSTKTRWLPFRLSKLRVLLRPPVPWLAVLGPTAAASHPFSPESTTHGQPHLDMYIHTTSGPGS